LGFLCREDFCRANRFTECCLKDEQQAELNIENSLNYSMLQKVIRGAYFEQITSGPEAEDPSEEINCSIIEQNQLIYPFKKGTIIPYVAKRV